MNDEPRVEFADFPARAVEASTTRRDRAGRQLVVAVTLLLVGFAVGAATRPDATNPGSAADPGVLAPSVSLAPAAAAVPARALGRSPACIPFNYRPVDCSPGSRTAIHARSRHR